LSEQHFADISFTLLSAKNIQKYKLFLDGRISTISAIVFEIFINKFLTSNS